ncbi:MAG: hypothetical protein ACT4N8_08695 [Sphingosinicella sp.]|uniref:hypothetical protein n=1 Tax=Sphingosinicella sp. TaxID=1917971 RepID=UPI004037C36B
MTTSRLVLIVLVLFVAASLIFGDRPWSLTSAPRVAEIDTLPDSPALASVRRYTEIGSGTLPYPARRTPFAPGFGPPPLKVGWAYREVSLVGMPLWAYPEGGLVTYFERPDGIQVALLGPEQAVLLDRITGRDYARRDFPWFQYVWGFLLPLGILLWTGLRRRELWRAEERFYEEAASRSA